MSKKPMTTKAAAEKAVKDICRATRKVHSSEEKIRLVLAGLRGEDSIAELCRRESIPQSLYYSWSKEFLEAGKKRLAADTARQATSTEVRDLRAESLALKEVVADLTLAGCLPWMRLCVDINRIAPTALRAFISASIDNCYQKWYLRLAAGGRPK